MKAISLHQPYASMIANGHKTIETRFWQTKYRGDLVICSTKKPMIKGHLCGYALCIVDLYDCIPMKREHEEKACVPYHPDRWAWLLTNIREISPEKVYGRQGFFTVTLIHELFKNKAPAASGTN